MSLALLPIELLDAICLHMRPVDLPLFALSNSFIHAIARRRLYRHLSISSVSYNLALVITLAKDHELAQHVRTFSLRLGTNVAFGIYYKFISAALSHMTELVSLDLFIDSSASWVLSETKSAYPRLLHFACSFALDEHVSAFLSRTDALLELEVDGAYPSGSLPTHLLPLPASYVTHLSSFVGASHVALAIVPGRPVESIRLPSGDLTEADVICLSHSSAQVAVLDATTSSLPIQILEALSQRMPYLLYLRLTTTCIYSVVPPAEFSKQISEPLSHISNLRGFELAGTHWIPSQEVHQGAERAWQSNCLVGDVFEAEDVDLDSTEFFFAY